MKDGGSKETGPVGLARDAIGSVGRGGPVLVAGMLVISGLFVLLWFSQARVNDTILQWVGIQTKANELMQRALEEMRRK